MNPQPTPDVTAAPPGRSRRIRDYYLRHRLSAGLGMLALLATNLFALLVPSLLGRAVDQVKTGQSASLVATTALLMAAVATGAAGARIASRGLLFWAGRSAENDIRIDLFRHLTTLAPSYYRSASVGDLVSRATNDLNNVRALMGFGVLTIINVSLVYLGNLPLLILLDLRLAAVALATIPLLVLMTRYGSRAIFKHSQQLQKVLGDLSARITENLAGMGVVRAFGREQAEIDSFETHNQAYYDASIRLVFVRNLLWPLAGLIFGVGTLAVLGYGGLRVIDGALSLGEFVEFNARLAALAWPTLAIGWVAGMWQRGKASMERLNQVFEVAPSIADAPDARPVEIDGALQARGLTVRYTGSEYDALHDVDFELPVGGMLGVVGKTGSGKSTLVRALVRLVELEPGQLFVDGQDITGLRLADLRRAISYADQDSFLFSDTVEANVRFSRPDATAEEVHEAIATAHLGSDLEALPEGIDTVVGERGVTLSGGQRQRTALARALLARPRLLLLDDCLSAVDAETEAKILADLRGVARRQTTVIVSHRLSAVRDADQIVVLDAGRVVERGHHDELLARGGLYCELWGEQATEQELEAAVEGVA